MAISGYVGDAGLDPDDTAQIHRDLLSPATPEELGALVSGPEDAAALVRAALLILAADGEVETQERGWLDRLGKALGLDSDRVRAIERDLQEAADE